ncbi:hypothetical protein J6590_086819 [Homalodisca vitripennis]|nr:hypothetical protein J6590_086819 [Homalodisca vitripennis]
MQKPIITANANANKHFYEIEKLLSHNRIPEAHNSSYLTAIALINCDSDSCKVLSRK